MKTNIYFWILFISCGLHLFSHGSIAQATLKWDKTLGGNDYDYLSSAINTSDGGYLLAGTSSSNISGDKSEDTKGLEDYWIIKVDGSGSKIWDKTFGGSDYDDLRSVIPASDGGYLLAGHSWSNISGDKSENSRGLYDYWIIKISDTGSKVWDKTYGGSSDDILDNVIPTSDGGYLLAGYSKSSASGEKSQNSKGLNDYWVIKIDKDGNKVWDKTFGGSNDDILISLISTSDGGYLLAGWSDSNTSADKSENSKGDFDYWIIKINGSGSKIWDKTLGGDDYDLLRHVASTSDGGYLLAGSSKSSASGDKSESNLGIYDYWVVKVDGSGSKIWDKTFGGSNEDVLDNVISTSDGNYLLAGSSSSNISADKSEDSKGLRDYWIIKINGSGSKIWDKTFGGNNDDLLDYVISTSDGGYLLSGPSSSNTSGDKSEDSKGGVYDYWIVKLQEAPSCTNPSPSFTVSNLCLNEAVQFTDASTQVAADATYTWDFGDGAISNTIGNVTHTYTATGSYTVELTITQGTCTSSYTQQVVVNALPTAIISGDATICAGGSTDLSVALTGTGPWSVTYTDGTTPVTVAATTSPLLIPVSPVSTTTYSLTAVSDANCAGTSLSGSATVTVTNQAPVIAGTLTEAPMGPNPVGTTVTVSDIVTDNNIASVEWHWNDGVVTAGSYDAGTNTASGQRTFNTPDVYTVTLVVTDHCGEPASKEYENLIVIYDPNGGFVTGGGWINSPAGAYAADPTLEGKATFGFVSKFKPGTNIPTGSTEFQFKAGNLNFKSISYEWLVVTGASAKFKGKGMINGGGDYGFMLSAVDGAIKGDGIDRFRIKIWDKFTETEQVVYDNEMPENDDADAKTVIADGSIVIHKTKSGKTARYDNATTVGKAIEEEGLGSPTAFKLNVYPNPVQEVLSVELESEVKEELTISIFDLMGRKVYEQKQPVVKGNNQIILDVASWKVDTDQLLFRLQTPSKGLHQLMLLKPE